MKNPFYVEMSEEDCPDCHLPLKKYATAGKTWFKCLSPFCGRMFTEDELETRKREKEASA